MISPIFHPRHGAHLLPDIYSNLGMEKRYNGNFAGKTAGDSTNDTVSKVNESDVDAHKDDEEVKEIETSVNIYMKHEA